VKQIQASKDLEVNEQMIEIHKKQMFILGQRMAQKHSDVDRSRAVVTELDQLIHHLNSRVNKM
jgi:predicted outer membrane protein